MTGATIWTDGLGDHEGDAITVEIERTEVDEVALHTFISGQGSVVSLYWSRERAVELARELLNAAALR